MVGLSSFAMEDGLAVFVNNKIRLPVLFITFADAVEIAVIRAHIDSFVRADSGR